MNRPLAAMMLLLPLLAGSCTTQRQSRQVDHVVLCWLKTPGDETAVRQIVETTATFKSIPGVVSIRAGLPVPSTRPVVDDSFDVGLVITFEDQAALHAYDQHPIHVTATRDVLRPLVSKVLIYDIEEGERKTATGALLQAPAAR